MKLSTYIMTGAFAVSLVTCVGVTLWINSQLFVPSEVITLSGESVDRHVGQFSSIESTDFGINYYGFSNENSRYVIQGLNSRICVVETDSIDEPFVTTYPALDDIVSVEVSDGVLGIAFYPDRMPAREGKYITYVNKIDVPVTVTVPRGLLKTMKGTDNTKFTLVGFETDSLEIDSSRKVIIDNSRIGLLCGNFSDAIVIRDSSDIVECRLNVSGESFRLKTENDSRFGTVQFMESDPDMKLDISQATILELTNIPE